LKPARAGERGSYAANLGETMKQLLIALAAAGCVAVALPASADEAMFKSNGCAKCHQAEKKGKGTSIKDMQAKYKGDAGKALAVVKGSDHPEVKAKDDDLKKLVGYAVGAK
jgi:cytochrome c551/c552